MRVERLDHLGIVAVIGGARRKDALLARAGRRFTGKGLRDALSSC